MVTEGNPVHEFVRAATALCPPDLVVDVTIDGRRRLTGVFAGALPGRPPSPPAPSPPRTVTQSVEGRFDVVLTTNGGHPLDRNLYQAVKGMAAAERVVAAGGIIVLAAACVRRRARRGRLRPHPRPAPSTPTSWPDPAVPARSTPGRPRCSAGSSRRAEVWVYSDGLSDADVAVGADDPGATTWPPRWPRPWPRQGPGPGCASCPRAR